MARTHDNARRSWRLVLVISLLVQNPTEVECKETTAAPAPAGVTTQARNRRLATTVAALPEEILAWEIFVRLPANDILRCRAVCRYWRGLTSGPDFLLAHHRRQPSLLLLTFYTTSVTNPTFERGHPILGLDGHTGFTIQASCDGLLLLTLCDGSFSVCNPATRQCAPLPCLTAADRRSINTAALYLHRPSGEYHVLYWKGQHQEDHLEAAYYILMVRRGRSPRCIGVPSHTPGTEKAMLAWNETTTADLASPVVFRSCLHWDPGCLRSRAGILVFDTVVESFRLMRGPADETTLYSGLCDMEGSISFRCIGAGMTVAKIWVLEDYEREVWSFKYHVKLSPWNLCDLFGTQQLVLSHKGDAVVSNLSNGYMLHYDNTGKVLEEFRCDPWSRRFIGPWFKESLVKHDFFPRKGCARSGQLRIFERL